MVEFPESALEPLRGTILTPGDVSSGPTNTIAPSEVLSAAVESSAPALEPLSGTILTPGKVLSGPTNTMAQTPISTQDQKSANSNPVITLPQPFIKTVPPTTTSMDYQTNPSSNRNRIQTLPSNSTLTDHPPVQNLPSTTLVGVPVPTAVQTVLLEVIISSAAGLGDAISAGMVILPPGASAMRLEMVNGAIESVTNGIEVVHIFPTTTLIFSTVSSVTAAATNAVQPMSASLGTIPRGPSAIKTSGNGGGGGNGSSVVTGTGGYTGTGSTTGSSVSTESVPSHTAVPVVPTGGAKGANGWEIWWPGFEVLVWGVQMVFWM